MATIVLTNAYVKLGTTPGDVSSYVKTVTLNYSAEMLDDTAMGDTTKSRKGGLKDWSVDLDLYQDYADDQIDEDIFALVGTTFEVQVAANGGTPSADNPVYTGTGILESFPPIGGTVGEMEMTRIRILAAGTLVRDITP